MVVGLTGKTATYAAQTRSFIRFYRGEKDRPRPFVGREQDLALLDAWLADSDAEPNLLLTAPAGRGKSMLLVQWLGRLAAAEIDVVFVPISLRYGTYRAAVYFEALATRLADLLGETLAAHPLNPAEYFKDEAARMLGALPREGRPCLVVIDGLDEATGSDINTTVLPPSPPRGLRIVVAARETALRDAEGWCRQIGWTLDRARVRCVDVPPLHESNVRAILRTNLRLEERERDRVAAELVSLTEGEPLLVQLYLDDLTDRQAKGEAIAAEMLAGLKPGYGAYFDDWFCRQEIAWREGGRKVDDRWKAVLAVLANAVGPLFQRDLEVLVDRVLGRPSIVDDDVMALVERFVLHDGLSTGYVLAHPRLADFLRGELLVRGGWSDRARAAFVDWGRDALGALTSSEAPPSFTAALGRHSDDGRDSSKALSPYLSTFYSMHLQRVGDVHALFALAESRAWCRAQMIVDPSGASYLADLGRAWDAVRVINAAGVRRTGMAPELKRELRIALDVASVHSLSGNIPIQLVIAAVGAGFWSLEDAVALARQVSEPAERSKALRALCDAHDEESAALLRREAFDAAAAADGPFRKRRELLLPLMREISREVEVVERAIAIASSREDREERKSELAFFAAYLPEDRGAALLLDALAGCREIATKVAIATSSPARLQCLAMPIVLNAIRALPATDEWRARHLAEVARVHAGAARDALAIEAFEATRAIADANAGPMWVDQARTRALIDVIPILPAQAIEAAREAVLSLADGADRVRALAVLAPRFAELGRVDDAVAALVDPDGGEGMWPALAPLLRTAEEIETALFAVERIEYEARRDEARAVLAARLVQLGRVERALAVAQSTEHPWFRVEALSLVAKALPIAMQRELLPSILEATKAQLARRVLGSRVEDLDGVALMQLAVRLACAGDVDAALDVARAFPTMQDDGGLGPLPLALTRLSEHVPLPRKRDVLREALAAARMIGDGVDRVRSMTRLLAQGEATSEHVSDFFEAAAETLRGVTDERLRATMLREMGPALTPTLLASALEMVRAMERPLLRVEALVALTRYAPADAKEALLAEALDLANARKWIRNSADAFVSLIAQLPEAKQREALAAPMQGWMLARLAPGLAASVQRDALDLALALSDPEERARALAALAPLLTEAMQRDVLGAIPEIPSEISRAGILSEILPRLPESLIDLAIARVNELRSLYSTADAIAALAPRLAELGRHREALDYVASIDWEQWTAMGDAGCMRANAIAAVARHLPDHERASLVLEAIAAAMHISDRYMRARALATLARVAEEWPAARARAVAAAFEAACEIGDGEKRMASLEATGPLLSGALVAKALTCIQHVPRGPYLHRSLRADALKALAPRLRELPREEAYALFSDTLRALARNTRSELVWEIAATSSVLVLLGGARAPMDAGRAILEAAKVWA